MPPPPAPAPSDPAAGEDDDPFALALDLDEPPAPPPPFPAAVPPPPGPPPAFGGAPGAGADGLDPLDLDFGSDDAPSRPVHDPALDAAAAAAGDADEVFDGMDDFAVTEEESMPSSPPSANPFLQSVAFAAKGPPGSSAPAPGDFDPFDLTDDDEPAPSVTRWHIRRRSGKVFGPFDSDTIVNMLRQAQLFGNEEISLDGNEWAPITSEPRFAQVAPKSEPPGLAAPGGGRVPPPVIPVMAPGAEDEGEAGPESDDGADAEEEKSAKGRKKKKKKKKEKPKKEKRAKKPGDTRPLGERLESLKENLADRFGDLPRKKALVGAVVAVVVLGAAGVVVGLATDYGYFGLKALQGAGSGRAAGASPASARLAAFSRHIEGGTAAGWRKALTSAQEAIQLDPKNPVGYAHHALASGVLHARYGGMRAELDQARANLDRHLGDSRRERDLAAAALALASGSQPRRSPEALVKDWGNDLRAVVLATELHLAGDRADEAESILNDYEGEESAELLLLRVALARTRGDAEAEVAALDAVEAAFPDHPRALLLRARLWIGQERPLEAMPLLEKVLEEELASELDPSEEALAYRTIGDLHMARRDFDEAEAAYRSAVDKDPGNAENRVSLAQAQLRQRKWDDAADQFTKALETGSGVEILVGRARALIESANYVEADEAVNRALSESEQHPAALVVAGHLAYRLNKIEEARQRFAEALEKDPEYVDALIADGRVLLEQGEVKKAGELLVQAEALEPENIEALILHGEVLLRTQRAQEALDAFTRAVELDDSWPAAHSGKGGALALLGSTEEARDAFEHAVELDPHDVSIRQAFANFLQSQGDGEGAVEQLRAAIEQEPNDAHLHARLGAVLLSLDRLDEAETALRASLARNNSEAMAHEYYGRLLGLRNETSRAVERLRRAVELNPTSAEPLYHLGRVHAGGQQFADAVDAYRRALEIDPEHLDAREQLAMVLASQSLYTVAVTEFEKLLELDPNRVSAMEALGDALFRLNRNEEALVRFSRALQLDPERHSLHYRLGRVHDKLGNLPQATRSYVRATEVDDTDPQPFYYLGFVYKIRGMKKEAIGAFRKYLELAPEARGRDQIEDEIYYLSR